MKGNVTLILIIVSLLLFAGCSSDSSSVSSISIDFPHGETRLFVERDGETRLYYGALPSYETVKQDTFDFDELVERLEDRVHEVAPAEGRPIGEPYGMVSFGYSDGSSRDFLIYDSVYTGNLFETARANVETPSP